MSASTHPHFDDRGTLQWHTAWADAWAAARAERKPIFLEIGRELCSSCRALVQGVVPHPAVAPLLQEHFVALAVDADEAEDEVMTLMLKMPDATMLPFVIFTDADGNFLRGSSGAVDPAQLARALEELVAAR